MIKDILGHLPQLDQEMLMLAFESESAHFVKLPDNKFIGVNVNGNPNLEILTREGAWCHGCLKDPLNRF